MGVLSKALAKIGEAVADFSSLTVTTYSGNIKIMVEKAKRDDANSANFNNMDLDKLFTYAVSGAQTDGEVKIMAVNVHKIDGDAIVYRDPSITEKLEQAHDAALIAGRETREGILNLVKGQL